jgi:hypothetical protein
MLRSFVRSRFKTVTFVRSVQPKDIDGSENREINLTLGEHARSPPKRLRATLQSFGLPKRASGPLFLVRSPVRPAPHYSLRALVQAVLRLEAEGSPSGSPLVYVQDKEEARRWTELPLTQYWARRPRLGRLDRAGPP